MWEPENNVKCFCSGSRTFANRQTLYAKRVFVSTDLLPAVRQFQISLSMNSNMIASGDDSKKYCLKSITFSHSASKVVKDLSHPAPAQKRFSDVFFLTYPARSE